MLYSLLTWTRSKYPIGLPQEQRFFCGLKITSHISIIHSPAKNIIYEEWSYVGHEPRTSTMETHLAQPCRKKHGEPGVLEVELSSKSVEAHMGRRPPSQGIEFGNTVLHVSASCAPEWHQLVGSGAKADCKVRCSGIGGITEPWSFKILETQPITFLMGSYVSGFNSHMFKVTNDSERRTPDLVDIYCMHGLCQG